MLRATINSVHTLLQDSGHVQSSEPSRRGGREESPEAVTLPRFLSSSHKRASCMASPDTVCVEFMLCASSSVLPWNCISSRTTARPIAGWSVQERREPLPCAMRTFLTMAIPTCLPVVSVSTNPATITCRADVPRPRCERQGLTVAPKNPLVIMTYLSMYTGVRLSHSQKYSIEGVLPRVVF